MNFIQPALLFALPLAVLPIVIHLIHLYRRRQVKWAAMMFLLSAQRMNKGLSRLRQILILAMRVLAIGAIIFAITRPLAGGWLGLTGGAPDTVMVLLDRSASMDQMNLATGVSKRTAGLRNVAKAINDAIGTRSRLVLIDSATCKPQGIEKADALLDLPQTESTDTGADIPALLQSALDYVTTNKSGRTDIWLLSDLQQQDWDSAGGRWERLRGAFSTLKGVRFHVLAYPQPVKDDLGVIVEGVKRRETSEKAELLLDLRITRHVDNPQPMEVPVRVVVNGTATTTKVTLNDNQLALQGFVIPVDKAVKRAWGRVELPADSYAANNSYHFVFDEPPVLRSIIVSDDESEAAPLSAALSAALDPSQKYEATVLPSKRVAEIPWEQTGLIVWNAPIPKPDDVVEKQLQEHAAAGRSILFLPPEAPDETAIFGLHWGAWESTPGAQSPDWWRSDSDLLANTRDGVALPVGSIEITRRTKIIGDGVPLARMNSREPLLVRSTAQDHGAVYFLGTLSGPTSSSLARDGVTMFAMLHRALNEGVRTLGKAQQRVASATALGSDAGTWRSVEDRGGKGGSLSLRAGVLTSGDQIYALNRPVSEDDPRSISTTSLGELFAGLDCQVLVDSVDNGRSLTNEVWRTFLMAMAAALIVEALLCMPPRREDSVKQSVRNSFHARDREEEHSLV